MIVRKIYIVLLFILLFFSCTSTSTNPVDITPHEINTKADLIYQRALKLSSYYDVDSTMKTLSLLDSALIIDSLNPDYYGLKAKLYSELGNLDSALAIQELADKYGAITGEYLFQLGLFQAAKNMNQAAKVSFKRSSDNLNAVLKEYPDSLGAFIIQQAANALYHENDSLYMSDVSYVRKRFSNRLMEVEMTRRVKPSYLIKQIKEIEKESLYPTDKEIEKLLNEYNNVTKNVE